MTREEVLRRLSSHQAELEGFGVRSLDLFGSVARGDSGPGRGVDLLVEFDRPVGLFHFFRLQRRLEAILGRPVDLVMKDAIKRQPRIGVWHADLAMSIFGVTHETLWETAREDLPALVDRRSDPRRAGRPIGVRRAPTSYSRRFKRPY